MKQTIFGLFLIIFSVGGMAQTNAPKVLSFAQWKNQQITDAQNRTIRISNRITSIKANSGNLKEISNSESELRSAAQYIEVVKDLTIEDYFNVYLSRYVDSRDALKQAAKSMSRDEVAELLSILLHNRSETAAL